MAKVKKQNKRKAKTVDEEEKQNKRKAKTVDEEEKQNKGKAKTVDEEDEPEVKDKKEVTPSGKRRKEPEKKDDGEANWDLGPAKKCTVRTFKEKVLIDIREFYEKDGKQLPGRKGISLTVEQYQDFRKHVLDGSIDAKIEELGGGDMTKVEKSDDSDAEDSAS